MTRRLLIILILILSLKHQLYAQCTTLGQTPATAFPVCGTSVFNQTTVPICSTNSLYVPGCTGNSNALYANKNPFWYKFTCYESGSLGFVITPNDPTDDYDWQLYDITGLDPNEVFTNANIIVTGNWAGNPGPTGTKFDGVGYIQCASAYNGTESRFARMPNIIQGHTYLLLVSHFTDSQSGYSLSFGGGTAVITDSTLPKLSTVSVSCDNKQLFVKLNKKMKCKSLVSDGSDFTVTAPGINVIAATGINCNNAFDMDSLVLTLSAPLPPGDWDLVIKNGSDTNTLLDNCDRNINPGDLLSFKIKPIQPTPMDSISPVACAPQTLQLVFSKAIKCASVSPDGSDFQVTGPYPVSIGSVSMDCQNGGSPIIEINLTAPVYRAGTYTISLKKGVDGNTLEDICGQYTGEGSSVSFTVKDTVNADFNYNIKYGCKIDTVQFFHPGGNGINNWQWHLDYAGPSNNQQPIAYFKVFGNKTITLKVSNGFCSDSVSRTIALDNELKALFETNNIICPEDSAIFKNTSIGKNVNYTWDFGNGFTSNQKDPVAQKYPLTGIETVYQVRLIAKDPYCSDTLIQPVKVLSSCFIAVPNAFTPNNDGLNDYLYPLNAFKAMNMKFRVYNRSGLLLYSSEKYDQKWDGTYKGEPQDAAIYVWTLEYTHADTGKRFFLKGSTMLIR